MRYGPHRLGPDPLALDRQVCFALSIASRSVRLEHTGYIPRERNHDDERALVVALTAAGENLCSEAEKVLYRVIEASER